MCLWSLFPISFVEATVLADTPMSDVVFDDEGNHFLAVVDATSLVGITAVVF